ncbi:MAG: hypothetical protein Q8R28_01700 [Dehalococcoidia bacterium]|nr:hypothetical protein [Dehalococcoidia bacterium]
MGRRSRLHRENLEKQSGAVPIRNQVTYTPAFKCGKCGGVVPEYNITGHLEKCWPNGADCVKCKDLILPADFLSHNKVCRGVKVDKAKVKDV